MVSQQLQENYKDFTPPRKVMSWSFIFSKRCCFNCGRNKYMSLRTLDSSNGWLSSEPVLSHQPYMPAVQVLVQFKSLEKVQTDREQRGEIKATSHEGPHASLPQIYSSLQISMSWSANPSQSGITFMWQSFTDRQDFDRVERKKWTIMALSKRMKSHLSIWG